MRDGPVRVPYVRLCRRQHLGAGNSAASMSRDGLTQRCRGRVPRLPQQESLVSLRSPFFPWRSSRLRKLGCEKLVGLSRCRSELAELTGRYHPDSLTAAFQFTYRKEFEALLISGGLPVVLVASDK